MISAKFEKNLKDLIAGCIRKLDAEGTAKFASSGIRLPEIELGVPRDKSHGDLSTNIALQLSKNIGKNPAEYAALIAEKINCALKKSPLKDDVEKAESKPPGFINFWFSEKSHFETLKYIADRKAKYGSITLGRGMRLNIEFVSANPTGPLTIAHGRQAAFGDTLANILQFAGYKVTREYYLNDEGNQITILAKSIRARYLELFGEPVEFPADGYKGSYINDIASAVKAKYGAAFVKKEALEFFSDFGCKWILGDIKNDLENFGVKFDVWYSQKKLGSSGKIKDAIGFLSKKKLTYEEGGALWFKSTVFGDDKDRVIIKSTGEYTYLAPDIAYHMHKFKRGFERLIDIWGPDHHGYIPRMKAAVKAMGRKEESFAPLIVQLSTLYRSGKAVQMSTRAGEFITLRELRDDVGKDVTRFFFLRRKKDSHLDFDMELAKKHSMENPVYYIQYAHARICSLLEYKKARDTVARGSLNKEYLRDKDEIDIIKMLGYFPLIVEASARTLEAFPLLSYLEEVASLFHSYYNKHRIVTDDARQTEAKLFLCLAIQTVLANGLRLIGVASPKSM
ncbi:MAG: arginine--tRNA ligase [Candidatus Omnitrophica bacterium]|nr:arginine--tRNA ligase [Candidatus Omnitrophota bacterium]